MPIQRLPALLVNQIAAGEVIERPASVVKELVENAIDAGACRIDVTIEQGGKELIRVSDDGCGIQPDELQLALTAHATSKISTAEDLDAIATMGFRGEALASIASVSRISLRSRPAAQDGAMQIEGEGEMVGEPAPAAGPVGTAVTVRNLFFNTPARRKFLRTDQTETGRVCDVVENIALSHPETAWTLTIDGRPRLDLPPGQAPRARALAILGRELEDELLDTAVNDQGMAIWGLAGRPGIARPNSRHLRVYLNGRLISDRSITHAIREAYRGLIEPNRYPTIVLFLAMEPSQVDVNVHPAKAEVRFRNQSAVHGAVFRAVRDTLRKADLMPAVDLSQGNAPSLAIPLPPVPEFGAGQTGQHGSADGQGPSYSAPPASAFVDYFKRLDPTQKGFVYSEVKQALAREAPEILDREEVEADRGRSGEPSNDLPGGGGVRAVEDVLQVHSSFIVTQDREGLIIIDQHALHERVLFERLKARIATGALESQRLLMPLTIDLDRRAVEALESVKPMLEQLGIEAELIGPSTLAIHAFTSLLFERKVEPAAFMQDVMSKAADRKLGGDSEAAIHEVLDMMACKAAVKAGDRLTTEELADLISQREAIERSSACPHGRPTSLRLSIQDLEKQFGRR